MRFAAMRFAIRRAAVTPQMTSVQVFVVASRVSAQSMKELMAQMGSQPGGLNFGTTGIDLPPDGEIQFSWRQCHRSDWREKSRSQGVSGA